MLTIGIDPDLHDLAIGFWADGKPLRAYVVHVPKVKSRTGQQAVLDMVLAMQWAMTDELDVHANAIAVEAQTLRRRGVKQHKRPEDIVVLGNVAGAVLGYCKMLEHSKILFPTPEEWKGSVPKRVMQARLYNSLGWQYDMLKDYTRPVNPPKEFFAITASQWKHVGDALLLAKWASEQVK